jgi:DNA polymerase I
MGRKCECPLADHVEVPFVGNRNADILFVGESPGNTEIHADRPKPFIDKAGQLLRQVARDAKIDIETCRVANSARCMVNKKQTTTKQQKDILTACRPKLIREIERCKPKLIVLLGDFALRQVLKTGGITKKRGSLIWAKEFQCYCLPMFHPAYILRYQNMKPFFEQDFAYLRRLQDHDFDPKNFVRPQKDYREASGIKKLLRLADTAEKPLYVSYDTETTALDFIKSETRVISYSVSWEEGQGRHIHLHYKRRGQSNSAKTSIRTDIIATQDIIPEKNIRQRLKQIRKLHEHPNIRIIMQNGNYDKHHTTALFRQYKMRPPKFSNYVMDLQVAAHVLSEAYKLMSLDALQRAFLGETSEWKREFYAKYAANDMISVPRHELALYANEDADITRRIGLVLIEKLRETPKLSRYFRKLVMPVESEALFSIEENGAYFDSAAVKEVTGEIEGNVKRFEKATIAEIPKWIKIAHKEKGIKLTRTDLIRDTLFTRKGFGIKPKTFTKTGAPVADKGVRECLRDLRLPRGALDFLDNYDLWSKWAGLRSKGIKQLVGAVREDGRLHSSYTTTLPVTGRVSSSNPCLMNVPKRYEGAKLILKLFAVPDDSWCLLWADASQAELRGMAHEARDSEMIKVYKAAGDIHLNTAKALVNKPWERLTKEEKEKARTDAKPANFGLLYGMSVRGFIAYCHLNYKIRLSERQAERYINAWFELYRGVSAYHREAYQTCKKYGYVESMLGRRRRLPEIYSDEMGIRNEAKRQAINFPIQSVASDLVLDALANILLDKVMAPKECFPVLFIHDALVFQCKRNHVEKYGKIVKHYMEHPPVLDKMHIKLRVPLVADIQTGPDASSLEDLKL